MQGATSYCALSSRPTVVTEVKLPIWLAITSPDTRLFPWMYSLRVSQNRASEAHKVRDDALKKAISPCGG